MEIPVDNQAVKDVKTTDKKLNEFSMHSDALLRSVFSASAIGSVIDDRTLNALDILTGSLKAEANLNRLGRYSAKSEILENLAIRKRLIEEESLDNAFLGESIVSPMIITGLPRTGTSILFELLAQDTERLRSPKIWEVKHPFDALTEQDIDDIDRDIKIAFDIAPDLRLQHDIGARFGEDCCRLLQLSFTGYRYMWQYDVPSQWRSIITEDLTSAYKMHKVFLQFMQYRNQDRRQWLLKSNGHVPFVEYLNSTYPTMNLIHTYRDPADAIASTVSMICTNRKIYSDRVDPAKIAREQVYFWKRSLSKYFETLDANPDVRRKVFGFSFAKYMKDPIDEIHRTYDFFDMELSYKIKDSIVDYLGRNAYQKHGAHRYSIEDYGMSRAQVYKEFEEYIDRFSIELSK